MTHIRIAALVATLGGAVVLTGCVAPGGVYSDGSYGPGYGPGYSQPYYSDPSPVYVAPPVYVEGGYYGGGYRGRPYYNNDRGYYNGRPGYVAPRPGFVPRPGFAPGNVAVPRPNPRPPSAGGAPAAAPNTISPNRFVPPVFQRPSNGRSGGEMSPQVQ